MYVSDITVSGYAIDARQNNPNINNTLAHKIELIRTHNFITGVISTNEDLNTYLTPGTYVCHQNVICATVANKPIGLNGNAFKMTVDEILGKSVGYVGQTIKDHNSGSLYYRVYWYGDNKWGPWNAIKSVLDA